MAWFFREMNLSSRMAIVGTAGAELHVNIFWVRWPELEMPEVLVRGRAGCEGGCLSDK